MSVCGFAVLILSQNDNASFVHGRGLILPSDTEGPDETVKNSEAWII